MQPLYVITHSKVFVVSTEFHQSGVQDAHHKSRSVTELLNKVGLVTLEAPARTSHSPVPLTGLLPCSVFNSSLHIIVSKPASAIVG